MPNKRPRIEDDDDIGSNDGTNEMSQIQIPQNQNGDAVENDIPEVQIRSRSGELKNFGSGPQDQVEMVDPTPRPMGPNEYTYTANGVKGPVTKLGASEKNNGGMSYYFVCLNLGLTDSIPCL